MNEPIPGIAAIPLRGKPTTPFCWQGGEIYDFFLPIMGADCLAVYGCFTRMEFSNPKLTHSIRGIAGATGLSDATVSRSLEILEYLGLIKLTRFGGSRDSECQLLDSRAVAIGMGVQYNRVGTSFSFPHQVLQRLVAQVKALREKQQGKSVAKGPFGDPWECESTPHCVSERNARVSPMKCQRSTREAQSRSRQLEKKEEDEEVPSPTPSQHEASQQQPRSTNDKTPEEVLAWSRACFAGAIGGLKDHLLNSNARREPSRTNGQQNSNLANGFEDWRKFDFNGLAVVAAALRGKAVELTISANDVDLAKSGAEKYQPTWDSHLRKAFGCEVLVTFVPKPFPTCEGVGGRKSLEDPGP
ncbi:MAG TPA: hypothetical protein VHX60_00940 [Acidobacteriaceae bacterium]|jgi:hypothetical protein|nr:hypothetical protein [Acidobacteriaceae bacterium]